jgi:hypothetical protein
MSSRCSRLVRPALGLACLVAACDGHGPTPARFGVDGGAEMTVVAID